MTNNERTKVTLSLFVAEYLMLRKLCVLGNSVVAVVLAPGHASGPTP